MMMIIIIVSSAAEVVQDIALYNGPVVRNSVVLISIRFEGPSAVDGTLKSKN